MNYKKISNFSKSSKSDVGRRQIVSFVIWVDIVLVNLLPETSGHSNSLGSFGGVYSYRVFFRNFFNVIFRLVNINFTNFLSPYPTQNQNQTIGINHIKLLCWKIGRRERIDRICIRSMDLYTN